IWLCFWAAAMLGLATGCSTFESRAKERSAVFAGLDEATKARLEEGHLQVGDTEDMVYIALGAPDEKRETLTSGGRDTTWVYNAYWNEYQGTRIVGYRRQVIGTPGTGNYQVYLEPIERDIYAPRVEERIRVTMRDGRVTVVEQVKG
ncbi:MAG: hypothetical protein ABII82_17290, partial [Verrucomicrobiota bacterium]